jgi:hypothetical protein
MTLQQRLLPYEIRKTACELFAGKTGFTQDEMQAFFSEEIRKAVPSPPYPPEGSGFWASFNHMMEYIAYDQRLRPRTQWTRAEAFEYWLSLLPLQRQKEILLELCQKPNFPMRRKPSLQQRKQLEVMLTNFVIDPHVSSALERLNSTYVLNVWQRAIARCIDGDPQGAITAARTLLESLCKHILDSMGSSYDENADFPRLYYLAAQELNIAPNQQTEENLRRVFGSCQNIINEVAALRNQLSDVHGIGRTGVEPSPSLGILAVNLAGSLAIFLVQVWEADPRSYHGC